MTEALQTLLKELKTLSPDIASVFVFKRDGETLAASENATPEQTQHLIAGLNSITQAESIGGIENFTIQDVDTQLSVAAVGEVYLAAVASRSEDQKIVNSLTKIVIPTVIQLAYGTAHLPAEKPKTNAEVLQQKIRAVLPVSEEPEVESAPELEAVAEPVLPQAPAVQFMVEKIGGLLVASDTVRIDSEVISKWQDLFGKQLTHVNIETLEGKTVACKFKPLRDAKANAKGIIQVPDKIMQALQTDKGKLVMAKPVIE